MSRLFTVFVAMLTILSTSLLTAQTAKAQTDSNWIVNSLPNFRHSDLHTSLNGEVAELGCSLAQSSPTNGPYLYAYNSANGVPESNLSGNIEANRSNCKSSGGGAAIGADGTIYNATEDGTVNSPAYDYPNTVVASKDGVVKWTLPILPPPANNCSDDPYVLKIRVGTDQDIYFVAETPNGCEYQGYLFGVDAESGQVKFKTPLTQGSRYELGVHNNGLVIFSNKYHDQGFQFFDYSGNKKPALTFEPTLSNDESIRYWSVHPSGTVYIIMTNSEDYSCTSGGTVDHKAMLLNLDETKHIYNIHGYCKQSIHFGIIPDGGAVLLVVDADGFDNTSLIYLHPDGSTDMVSANGQESEGSEVYRGFHVDMHGNALTIQSLGNRDVYFTLFGPDGAILAEYSTSSLRIDDNEEFELDTNNATAIAQGAAYADICYSDQYASCDDNPSYYKLLKISFAELSFDYPRAAILGYQAQPVETLKYVAMGDSFSSGEGVPPFEPPSDTNGCHKSYDAYANLLDNDPSLTLQMTNFVACSGAIADDVAEVDTNRTPQHGLPLQTVSIPTDADAITISIGGNDVEFKEYAISCVNPITFTGCGISSNQYVRTQNKINNELPSKLATVYAAIRAAAPNAHIYVLGYPHLVPFSQGDYEPGTCRYLDQVERTNARDVVTNLNYTISNAVDAADAADGGGDGFTYVSTNDDGSPFIGHELCSATPYFNDLSYPVEYTFHPNASGHEKYDEILEGVI